MWRVCSQYQIVMCSPFPLKNKNLESTIIKLAEKKVSPVPPLRAGGQVGAGYKRVCAGAGYNERVGERVCALYPQALAFIYAAKKDGPTGIGDCRKLRHIADGLRHSVA